MFVNIQFGRSAHPSTRNHIHIRAYYFHHAICARFCSPSNIDNRNTFRPEICRTNHISWRHARIDAAALPTSVDVLLFKVVNLSLLRATFLLLWTSIAHSPDAEVNRRILISWLRSNSFYDMELLFNVEHENAQYFLQMQQLFRNEIWCLCPEIQTFSAIW